MKQCKECIHWYVNRADPLGIVGGCQHLDPPNLVRMLASDFCSKWHAITPKVDFSQTIPATPTPVWTQMTEAPKLQSEDYFIFLVENGEEKYLYCDLSIAAADMIAWDSPVQIYNWDVTNKRFAHYLDLIQCEV